MPDIKWNIKKQDSEKVKKISDELNINESCAKILINRGYDEPEKVKSFLSYDESGIHDPYLLEDMGKSVERIIEAGEKNEKILIYGDYDVDGISSTCLLYLFLKSHFFDVSFFIPDRFDEGYGINKEALSKAAENNTTLVITVDTGVTAVEEIKYANKLGVDVIITDHHECHENLPQAFAVINPKRADSVYPYKELAGVGVAFKLVDALMKKKYPDDDIMDYTEFFAMGTIADIMPLENENRILTYYGLRKMKNSKNFGIKAILEHCFIQKNASTIPASVISYNIAPRLNAAGRLYSATKSVELFITDSMAEASLIAEELSVMNEQRKNAEKEIMFEAVRKLGKNFETDKKVIILYDDNWNQGIIGIVASKLLDKYNKAFILLTKDSDETYKGSCRSLKNINIIDALKECSDMLQKFGGHELAAGLTVKKEKIELLEAKLNEYLKNNKIEIIDEKEIDVDFEFNPAKLEIRTIKEINILEPFGNKNPVPIYMLTNCKIKNVTYISNNKHIKIFFRSGNFDFEAMMFNYETKNLSVNTGDICDFLFEASVNEYRGEESLQLLIREYRLVEQNKNNTDKYDYYYRQFNANEPVSIDKIGYIERDDFRDIYKFLLRNFQKDIENEINIDEFKFFKNYKKNITFIKYKLLLDIFCEMDILSIKYENYGEQTMIKMIKINNKEVKIDLESSTIYKKYKNFYMK